MLHPFASSMLLTIVWGDLSIKGVTSDYTNIAHYRNKKG